jgi:hypothetical protein
MAPSKSSPGVQSTAQRLSTAHKSRLEGAKEQRKSEILEWEQLEKPGKIPFAQSNRVDEENEMQFVASCETAKVIEYARARWECLFVVGCHCMVCEGKAWHIFSLSFLSVFFFTFQSLKFSVFQFSVLISQLSGP